MIHPFAFVLTVLLGLSAVLGGHIPATALLAFLLLWKVPRAPVPWFIASLTGLFAAGQLLSTFVVNVVATVPSQRKIIFKDNFVVFAACGIYEVGGDANGYVVAGACVPSVLLLLYGVAARKLMCRRIRMRRAESATVVCAWALISAIAALIAPTVLSSMFLLVGMIGAAAAVIGARYLIFYAYHPFVGMMSPDGPMSPSISTCTRWFHGSGSVFMFRTMVFIGFVFGGAIVLFECVLQNPLVEEFVLIPTQLRSGRIFNEDVSLAVRQCFQIMLMIVSVVLSRVLVRYRSQNVYLDLSHGGDGSRLTVAPLLQVSRPSSEELRFDQAPPQENRTRTPVRKARSRSHSMDPHNRSPNRKRHSSTSSQPSQANSENPLLVAHHDGRNSRNSKQFHRGWSVPTGSRTIPGQSPDPSDSASHYSGSAITRYDVFGHLVMKIHACVNSSKQVTRSLSRITPLVLIALNIIAFPTLPTLCLLPTLMIGLVLRQRGFVILLYFSIPVFALLVVGQYAVFAVIGQVPDMWITLFFYGAEENILYGVQLMCNELLYMLLLASLFTIRYFLSHTDENGESVLDSVSHTNEGPAVYGVDNVACRRTDSLNADDGVVGITRPNAPQSSLSPTDAGKQAPGTTTGGTSTPGKVSSTNNLGALGATGSPVHHAPVGAVESTGPERLIDGVPASLQEYATKQLGPERVEELLRLVPTDSVSTPVFFRLFRALVGRTPKPEERQMLHTDSIRRHILAGRLKFARRTGFMQFWKAFSTIVIMHSFSIVLVFLFITGSFVRRMDVLHLIQMIMLIFHFASGTFLQKHNAIVVGYTMFLTCFKIVFPFVSELVAIPSPLIPGVRNDTIGFVVVENRWELVIYMVAVFALSLLYDRVSMCQTWSAVISLYEWRRLAKMRVSKRWKERITVVVGTSVLVLLGMFQPPSIIVEGFFGLFLLQCVALTISGSTSTPLVFVLILTAVYSFTVVCVTTVCQFEVIRDLLTSLADSLSPCAGKTVCQEEIGVIPTNHDAILTFFLAPWMVAFVTAVTHLRLLLATRREAGDASEMEEFGVGIRLHRHDAHHTTPATGTVVAPLFTSNGGTTRTSTAAAYTGPTPVAAGRTSLEHRGARAAINRSTATSVADSVVATEPSFVESGKEGEGCGTAVRVGDEVSKPAEASPDREEDFSTAVVNIADREGVEGATAQLSADHTTGTTSSSEMPHMENMRSPFVSSSSSSPQTTPHDSSPFSGKDEMVFRVTYRTMITLETAIGFLASIGADYGILFVWASFMFAALQRPSLMTVMYVAFFIVDYTHTSVLLYCIAQLLVVYTYQLMFIPEVDTYLGDVDLAMLIGLEKLNVRSPFELVIAPVLVFGAVLYFVNTKGFNQVVRRRERTEGPESPNWISVLNTQLFFFAGYEAFMMIILITYSLTCRYACGALIGLAALIGLFAGRTRFHRFWVRAMIFWAVSLGLGYEMLVLLDAKNRFIPWVNSGNNSNSPVSNSGQDAISLMTGANLLASHHELMGTWLFSYDTNTIILLAIAVALLHINSSQSSDTHVNFALLRERFSGFTTLVAYVRSHKERSLKTLTEKRFEEVVPTIVDTNPASCLGRVMTLLVWMVTVTYPVSVLSFISGAESTPSLINFLLLMAALVQVMFFETMQWSFFYLWKYISMGYSVFIILPIIFNTPYIAMNVSNHSTMGGVLGIYAAGEPIGFNGVRVLLLMAIVIQSRVYDDFRYGRVLHRLYHAVSVQQHRHDELWSHLNRRNELERLTADLHDQTLRAKLDEVRFTSYFFEDDKSTKRHGQRRPQSMNSGLVSPPVGGDVPYNMYAASPAMSPIAPASHRQTPGSRADPLLGVTSDREIEKVAERGDSSSFPLSPRADKRDWNQRGPELGEKDASGSAYGNLKGPSTVWSRPSPSDSSSVKSSTSVERKNRIVEEQQQTAEPEKQVSYGEWIGDSMQRFAAYIANWLRRYTYNPRAYTVEKYRNPFLRLSIVLLRVLERHTDFFVVLVTFVNLLFTGCLWEVPPFFVALAIATVYHPFAPRPLYQFLSGYVALGVFLKSILSILSAQSLYSENLLTFLSWTILHVSDGDIFNMQKIRYGYVMIDFIAFAIITGHQYVCLANGVYSAQRILDIRRADELTSGNDDAIPNAVRDWNVLHNADTLRLDAVVETNASKQDDEKIIVQDRAAVQREPGARRGGGNRDGDEDEDMQSDADESQPLLQQSRHEPGHVARTAPPSQRASSAPPQTDAAGKTSKWDVDPHPPAADDGESPPPLRQEGRGGRNKYEDDDSDGYDDEEEDEDSVDERVYVDRDELHGRRDASRDHIERSMFLSSMPRTGCSPLSFFRAVRDVTRDFVLNSIHVPGVGRDWYVWYLLLEMLALIVFLFGYNTMTSSNDGTLQESVKRNLLPATLVSGVLATLVILLVDRMLYVKQYMLGKLIFNCSVGITYCILYWVWRNKINVPTVVGGDLFFLVKCAAVYVSALQLRLGYPRHREHDPFTVKPNSLAHFCMYQVYRSVPFLWEARVVTDWTVERTSLRLMQYLRVEDLYDTVYRRRKEICDARGLQPYIGAPINYISKSAEGMSRLALIVLVLIAPLMYYSTFNPSITSNEVITLQTSLSFMNSQSYFTSSVYDWDSYDGSLTQWIARTRPSVASENFVSAQKNAQLIDLSSCSNDIWPISPQGLRLLKTNLQQVADGNSSMDIILQFGVTTRTTASATSATETTTARWTIPTDTAAELYQMINDTTSNDDENGSSNSSSSSTNTDDDDFVMLPNFYSPFVYNDGSSVTMFSSFDKKKNYVNCSLKLRTEEDPLLKTNVRYWCIKCDALFTSGNTPSNNLTLYPEWNCLQNYLNCDDYNFETPNASKTYVPVPMYFVVASDQVVQGVSFLQGIGLVALYTTFVLAVGRFLRSMMSDMAINVLQGCMANPMAVYQLLELISIARECGELRLEYSIYFELIDLLRSPEKLLRLTGYNRSLYDPVTDQLIVPEGVIPKHEDIHYLAELPEDELTALLNKRRQALYGDAAVLESNEYGAVAPDDNENNNINNIIIHNNNNNDDDNADGNTNGAAAGPSGGAMGLNRAERSGDSLQERPQQASPRDMPIRSRSSSSGSNNQGSNDDGHRHPGNRRE